MKKKLLTQIKNEWRTNLWLAVELLVVSVVLWYVVDYFYTTISVRNLPRGFDVEHCYLIKFNDINVKSPEFIPDRSAEDIRKDKMELLDRVRRRPEVEFASMSNNSYPYNGSNSGTFIMYRTDTDTVYGEGYVVRRAVTPDFVRVFRYTGANGETSEDLARKLEEGTLLVSSNLFDHYDGLDVKDLIGKEFYYGDTTNIMRLGAAYLPVRYHDYTSTWSMSVAVNDMVDVMWLNELCIRVKPEMDFDVRENILKDAPSQLRVGNLMITDVVSFDDVRRNYQRYWSNDERNYYAGMGFLLLNIFLGLLGTFWFRTQQRVGEIAIRKVNGATDISIFRRLIGEGLLLLVIATIPAVLIDVALSFYEFNSWYNGFMGWGRTTLCILITAAMMAIMIILGIIIPAYRAMNVNPAIALKDE